MAQCDSNQGKTARFVRKSQLPYAEFMLQKNHGIGMLGTMLGTMAPIALSTRLITLIALIFCLSGCQSGHQDNTDTKQLILNRSLQNHVIDTPSYPIWSLSPPLKSSNTLRIYIEGDGRAWLRKGVVSTDPTPRNRLIHRLMLQDSKTDIAYLARPCQFIMGENCSRNSWTFSRYSQDSLLALNTAVTSLKNRNNYEKLELVGYSGGATMALLIAANRKDVISVRTVAGNLVPDYTNSLHQVSPMPEALSPVDHKTELIKLPQIHFVGTKDRVVPLDVARNYQQRLAQTKCIQIRTVERASHSSYWAESWPYLLKKLPVCK